MTFSIRNRISPGAVSNASSISRRNMRRSTAPVCPRRRVGQALREPRRSQRPRLEDSIRRDDAAELAEHSIDSWNARDLEAVLAHFDEAAPFTSPRAIAVCGRGSLVTLQTAILTIATTSRRPACGSGAFRAVHGEAGRTLRRYPRHTAGPSRTREPDGRARRG